MDTNLMELKAMTNLKSGVDLITSASLCTITIANVQETVTILAGVITIIFTGFKLFEGIYNFRRALHKRQAEAQNPKFKR